MKKKSISLVIKSSKKSNDEKSVQSPILTLKAKLEEHDIDLVHLELLNHLVVSTTSEKWNKLIKQMDESEMKNFDIVENKIV